MTEAERKQVPALSDDEGHLTEVLYEDHEAMDATGVHSMTPLLREAHPDLSA